MGFLKSFFKSFVLLVVLPTVAFGAQAPNMRGSTNARGTSNGANDSVSSASIRRAATSVIARSAGQNGRKARTVVSARPSFSRAAVANRVISARSAGNVISGTPNISRAATTKSSFARSAKGNSVVRSATGPNISRAGHTRATSIFNDVSKIGGGYSSCRDSYATCMDQFCALASDTYRRCFCSDRFVNYRNTEDSLETALAMLADFQNNNISMVDKTAAEVSAMYSASEGEAAIKRDTSASQKMLDDIADILSGKKPSTKTSSANNNNSGNLLNVSGMFSSVSDNVWDTSDMSSLFAESTGSTYTNTADLEGAELYETAVRQCTAVSRNECGNEAMFNLARSAYSVLVTQDCNLYEKNINAKKESLQDTVRTVEKYLREARLAEYRNHNSQDVNECLNKVETAITQPTACGQNYAKCLDYSGRYINSLTGEPIYSKALFALNSLIVLDGSADVLGANPDFNNFLEEKKMFVTQALDTCRELADTVWYEFKRSALIQIAQAQDEKIQEVKDSCVQTVRQCYDQQTDSMNDLGDEEVNRLTGAISAVAAHEMCRDQVLACAALYGNPDSCVYDDRTKSIKDKDGGCGLKALLAYVNTVDSVKIAQGCEESLREYAKELCAATGSDYEYPWGCRLRSEADIRSALKTRAKYFCGKDLYQSSSTSSSGGRGTGSGSGSSSSISRPKTISVTEATQTATSQANVSQNLNASSAIRFRAATTSGSPVTVMVNPVVTPSQAASSNSQTTTNTNPEENYRDLDTNIISNIADSDKIIENIVSEIRTSLVDSLSYECMNIEDEGQLYWAASNTGINNNDVISVSPAWMEIVFGSGADLGYLKQTGFGGYEAKVENTGVTLKKSGSKSFGWGVCMKPTESQLCKMQLDLPKMTDSDVKFENGKCVIKSGWYNKRCSEIGGYWSGGRCYVK